MFRLKVPEADKRAILEARDNRRKTKPNCQLLCVDGEIVLTQPRTVLWRAGEGLVPVEEPRRRRRRTKIVEAPEAA